jgi:cytochrome P450
MSTTLLPSGPKGHFLLGVMQEFNRDSLGFIERLAREYGDIVPARFFYIRTYFLYHPDDIESVLATNNRNFIKPRSVRSPFFCRLVGNGLLTSEGEFWRRQRRLAQPAFHRQRINAYGLTMVAYAEQMLANWREDEERDIHQEMTHLTMQVVTRTLFDTDVTHDAQAINAALQVIVEPFSSQATLKWILDNRLPTRAHRRFYQAVRQIDDFIYRIINERRASGEDHGDLLSMLLQAQDETDGTGMTDQQLRDETMTLFLAGYETTSLALSWAWYLLAQHPEAEAKLWQELDEVLEGRAPRVEDMPRLRYTEMIAKETMRLYPPAYIVGREALKDCEFGGQRIPAGTQLFMPTWVVHRDARFYEHPAQFRPERWTPEFTAQLPRYAYFPFGGGPRVCIGNTFAMMEFVLLMATIAQRFRLRLVPGQKVELNPAMSLRPRHGINVVLHERAINAPVKT